MTADGLTSRSPGKMHLRHVSSPQAAAHGMKLAGAHAACLILIPKEAPIGMCLCPLFRKIHPILPAAAASQQRRPTNSASASSQALEFLCRIFDIPHGLPHGVQSASVGYCFQSTLSATNISSFQTFQIFENCSAS